MLRGVIVWTPMLLTDSLAAANENEMKSSDSRLMHYWDPDRVLGRFLAETLHLKESIAWDVYLVYPPRHPWEEKLPPQPAFWMHQLNEEPTLLLDPLRLKEYIQVIIESVKDK